MTTLVALYDDFTTARTAIEALVDANFSRDDIGLVARDVDEAFASWLDRDVESDEGAGFGAVVGTLIGLGAVLLPGVGTVIGGGTLAAAALAAGIGAAAGAATGGLVASLVDLGIDDEDAEVYAESLRRGCALVTLKLTSDDQRKDEALTILNAADPIDIDSRRTFYSEGGWAGYDPHAAPYSEVDIERDRAAWRNHIQALSGADNVTTERNEVGDPGARYYPNVGMPRGVNRDDSDNRR